MAQMVPEPETEGGHERDRDSSAPEVGHTDPTPESGEMVNEPEIDDQG